MSQTETAEKGQEHGNAPTLADKVEQVVTYHKPDELGVARITNIRQAAAIMIETIIRNCPSNADRSAAIRKVREAMMTANAAIVVPSHEFRESPDAEAIAIVQR